LVAVNSAIGGPLETVNYTNTTDLRVEGLAGSDTFNVTPSPSTTIFIDGGDPIGSTPGDVLQITAGGSNVAFTPGPHSDEGGFSVGANQLVSFAHIESTSVTGTAVAGQTATLSGTSEADVITVGGTGTNSFTAAISDGAT